MAQAQKAPQKTVGRRPVPVRKQVKIVNFPGKDLDLLPVYRDAAAAVKSALAKP